MAPLPSVLVADYVDHTARAWVSALSRLGYAAQACRPVDVRPALLQSHRTQLLVLAISRLRHPLEFKNLDGQTIPVLAVTADPADRGREDEIGCQGILLRPVPASVLLRHVREILGLPPAAERASESRVPLSARGLIAFSSALRETAERLSSQASLLRAQSLELCACSTGLLQELPEHTPNGGG